MSYKYDNLGLGTSLFRTLTWLFQIQTCEEEKEKETAQSVLFFNDL